ncbi:MAG: sulfatase-like hydrolase/transferase [Cyanobium sp.]
MSKPNILVLCNDEEQHYDFYLSLLPPDKLDAFKLKLKARKWFLENGVSFDNHHGTSIPCTSSRSVMWTGHHAPDTQLVDNMEFPYQISLGRYDAKETGALSTEYGPPTLGHLFRDLGYYPAYQGKVHLAQDVQLDSAEEMYQRYGFNNWSGTTRGSEVKDFEGPNMGHQLDPTIAEKADYWLRNKAPEQPWLLLVNFINPHDTMLVNIDGSGQIQVQQSTQFPILPSPYTEWWNPVAPANFTLNMANDIHPRPQAHDIFASICSATFGNIPYEGQCQVKIDGKSTTVPMWQAFLNHYLNCIVDNDAQMWTVLNAFLTEPKLAKARENTLLVWTSDHGDMMMSHGGVSSYYQEGRGGDDTQTAHHVWMPLRQKGPFIFRENYKVPMVVASLSRTLVPAPKSRTPVLSNHTDLVPTLLAWGGADQDWYRQRYTSYLQRLALPLKTTLCGKDLGPVVKAPAQYTTPQWGGRSALLFTYDCLNSQDPQVAADSADGVAIKPTHYENRACMRGFFDGKYKYARYFSALNYARQYKNSGNYAQLTQVSGSAGNVWYGMDLVLIDTMADPTELHNRILQANGSSYPTPQTLNDQLDKLMEAELYDPQRVPNTLQQSLDNLPWVFKFSPSSGSAGQTLVTIRGPGLTNRPEVYFSGVRAFNVVVNADNSLGVYVPLGAGNGPITVRTSKGVHTSVASFTISG